MGDASVNVDRVGFYPGETAVFGEMTGLLRGVRGLTLRPSSGRTWVGARPAGGVGGYLLPAPAWERLGEEPDGPCTIVALFPMQKTKAMLSYIRRQE